MVLTPKIGSTLTEQDNGPSHPDLYKTNARDILTRQLKPAIDTITEKTPMTLPEDW
jgi:hypothetical protein